jgi:hypothetical protein
MSNADIRSNPFSFCQLALGFGLHFVARRAWLFVVCKLSKKPRASVSAANEVVEWDACGYGRLLGGERSLQILRSAFRTLRENMEWF